MKRERARKEGKWTNFLWKIAGPCCCLLNNHIYFISISTLSSLEGSPIES